MTELHEEFHLTNGRHIDSILHVTQFDLLDRHDEARVPLRGSIDDGERSLACTVD
jgi:hypothetical protein